MNKRLIQIDHDTGEVVDGFCCLRSTKTQNGFQQGWLAMAQNGAEILAKATWAQMTSSTDEAAVCVGL